MSWGPEMLPDGVRLRLWAPDADAVRVEVQEGPDADMAPAGDGWWAAVLPIGAGARYRFRMGDLVVPDPASRAQDGGVHGWSVIVPPVCSREGGSPGSKTQSGVAEFSSGSPLLRGHGDRAVTAPPPFVPSAVEGHAAGGSSEAHASTAVGTNGEGETRWRGRPWHEMVILEVHAGLLGGFAGLAAHLPEIAAAGITAIELMPIGAFGGTRGWGYDGVLPYAVQEDYGTPAELRALVDAAHARGISVFLDVVYNHFGPDGNYLGAYAADFFDSDRHTPWGGAVAVRREPVARFFIDNALMWLRDYGIDGLRFDAVHAIGDPMFLDRMAAEIRAALPDRHVHLVLENESNDAARLRPDAYNAQWNDDFHNVLHVLLTGEQHAYYGDFAERPAERLARCLAEGFIYQGEGSPNHDGTPRGSPSGHLPPTAFVAFLQNHDQIGNRAMGERLTVLADPTKLRAATALLLLCPHIPLLFMGEPEGSETSFLFFTDFQDDLADAVREGRRREFAKFPAFADAEARATIPDPNALETFERSRPTPGDAAWGDLHRTLLTLRRERIVPHLPGARAIGAEVTGEAAVTARWRLGDGSTLTIAIDLGDTPAPLPTPATPLFVEGARFVAWIGS